MAPQQIWSGSTTYYCDFDCLFVCLLVCFCFCFVDGYVTRNHLQLVAWSLSWWYFVTSLYNNAQIYTHIYSHIPTYAHTYIYKHKHTHKHIYIYKVLLTVYYSSYLVVSSCRKPYESYFGILCSYKHFMGDLSL